MHSRTTNKINTQLKASRSIWSIKRMVKVSWDYLKTLIHLRNCRFLDLCNNHELNPQTISQDDHEQKHNKLTKRCCFLQTNTLYRYPHGLGKAKPHWINISLPISKRHKEPHHSTPNFFQDYQWRDLNPKPWQNQSPKPLPPSHARGGLI